MLTQSVETELNQALKIQPAAAALKEGKLVSQQHSSPQKVQVFKCSNDIPGDAHHAKSGKSPLNQARGEQPPTRKIPRSPKLKQQQTEEPATAKNGSD